MWVWGGGGLRAGADNEPGSVPPDKLELDDEERRTVALFQKVSPSVVSVTMMVPRGFYGGEQAVSAGSGFVWDAAGHVVTNWHVIRQKFRGQTVQVSFADMTTHTCKIVGEDRDNDIAVLKLEGPVPTGLQPVELGKSGTVCVGQKVCRPNSSSPSRGEESVDGSHIDNT